MEECIDDIRNALVYADSQYMEDLEAFKLANEDKYTFIPRVLTKFRVNFVSFFCEIGKKKLAFVDIF